MLARSSHLSSEISCHVLLVIMPDNDDGTISLIYMTQICCRVQREEGRAEPLEMIPDDPRSESVAVSRLHQLNDQLSQQLSLSNRHRPGYGRPHANTATIRYMEHSISISNKRLECFVLFSAVFFQLTLLSLLLLLFFSRFCLFDLGVSPGLQN